MATEETIWGYDITIELVMSKAKTGGLEVYAETQGVDWHHTAHQGTELEVTTWAAALPGFVRIVRMVPLDGKPHGWGVKIYRRADRGREEYLMHRAISSQRAAARWARLTRGFLSISDMEPFSRSQWLRTFGDGRLRM